MARSGLAAVVWIDASTRVHIPPRPDILVALTPHARLIVDIPTAIARYLDCGDSDPESRVWPGGHLDRHVLAHRELRSALVAEVRSRAVGVAPAEVPDAPIASSQHRIELMVRGLFPAAEQEIVLARLRTSVVLITQDNIDALIQSLTWDRTAWVIANMYLRSLGLEALSGDDSTPVGMSEETTCYVTPECLVEADPFADFVVHEAAHIFHNCKRGTLGLRQTRTREWLLDIDFHHRETFAYACEAYSRVIDGAADRRERLQRAEAFAQGHRFPEHAVDMPQVIDIVRAAAASRSGWKLILARCAQRHPAPQR